MDLQIDINGRQRTIGIEPRDGRQFAVTMDGETRVVDVAVVDDTTLSFILPAEGCRSEEIGLAGSIVPGEMAVHLESGVATVRLVAGGGRFGRGAGPAQAAGTQRVLAPMPGKVVKVLVKVGDEVKARQGLVVVEAMKMENELRSPKDGRVVEVVASEGMPVEAGRLLVVVE